jgi:hypothetical protein
MAIVTPSELVCPRGHNGPWELEFAGLISYPVVEFNDDGVLLSCEPVHTEVESFESDLVCRFDAVGNGYCNARYEHGLPGRPEIDTNPTWG